MREREVEGMRGRGWMEGSGSMGALLTIPTKGTGKESGGESSCKRALGGEKKWQWIIKSEICCFPSENNLELKQTTALTDSSVVNQGWRTSRWRKRVNSCSAIGADKIPCLSVWLRRTKRFFFFRLLTLFRQPLLPCLAKFSKVTESAATSLMCPMSRRPNYIHWASSWRHGSPIGAFMNLSTNSIIRLPTASKMSLGRHYIKTPPFVHPTLLEPEAANLANIQSQPSTSPRALITWGNSMCGQNNLRADAGQR